MGGTRRRGEGKAAQGGKAKREEGGRAQRGEGRAEGGSDCNRFADVFYFSPSTAV